MPLFLEKAAEKVATCKKSWPNFRLRSLNQKRFAVLICPSGRSFPSEIGTIFFNGRNVNINK